MDLEDLLYRIINGYYTISIDDVVYKIICPNTHLRYEAHKLYNNIIDDHKFDIVSWITKDQINHLLKTYNIWNADSEKQLNEWHKKLDQSKIELYKNFSNSDIRSEIKDLIRNTEKQINNLYSKKHYFDYLTLEYYAQSIKSQFLICHTILDKDNNKVFDFLNFNNIDILFLEKIISHISDNTIDINTIKKIARCELWKSFWGVSKENIFDGKIKEWTDEQRSLVNFSKILDNIREHMEAPPEEIINDDDALDGWILFQHDKQNKEKQKKQISDRYNLSDKKGNEIFVLTNNQEEKQSIYHLNDTQTNKDIKEMINITKEKGNTKWTDLPHVQRDIKQQLMMMKKEQ